MSARHTLWPVLLLACLTASQPAFSMSGMMAMSAGSPTAPCGQGTVVRVDASIGRVVIRHDEMESLGMPAMTTAFRVHDRSLLQDLHAGERIEFRVVPSDDGLIVTALTLNQ